MGKPHYPHSLQCCGIDLCSVEQTYNVILESAGQEDQRSWTPDVDMEESLGLWQGNHINDLKKCLQIRCAEISDLKSLSILQKKA